MKLHLEWVYFSQFFFCAKKITRPYETKLDIFAAWLLLPSAISCFSSIQEADDNDLVNSWRPPRPNLVSLWWGMTGLRSGLYHSTGTPATLLCVLPSSIWQEKKSLVKPYNISLSLGPLWCLAVVLRNKWEGMGKLGKWVRVSTRCREWKGEGGERGGRTGMKNGGGKFWGNN